MVFKTWIKINFVLCQPGYYNLVTEKKYKKIHVFEVPLCQSQEILLKHHL